MSTPEILKDLFVTIRYIQKEPNSTDLEKIEAAQEAYQELLNIFYQDYQDRMAPMQYKKAKDDPDYFLTLIHLAYYDHIQINVDNSEWKLLSYRN